MSKSPSEIYAEVTDRIIASLKEGNIPWHRPWTIEGGVHRSFASKKPYRGINQFVLDLVAMSNGWRSPWWLTYNQAKKQGGQVKKGEKGTMVTFWKLFFKEETDAKGKKIKKTIPMLRYFIVFNAEQCEGLEDKIPALPASEFTPIERAQAIIDQMPDAPKIKHGARSAYYQPGEDIIGVPHKREFHLPEGYYSTTYHELVHSTGHSKRLNRCEFGDTFGSDPYAKEELVAELGSAMLCGLAGIVVKHTQENQEAYIRSWVSRLEDDPKLIVHAASKAQQAADFIIGQHEREDDE